MRSVWTLARDERLRSLALDHTAAQIADILGEGLTRNAVIGRASRLGVSIRAGERARAELNSTGLPSPVESGVASAALEGADDAAPVPVRAMAESAPKPARETKRERGERWRARKASTAAPAEYIADPPPVPPAGPMTLLDDRFRLGRNCRWSVGEVEEERRRHLFCAAPVSAFGDVYCAQHAVLARATPAQMAERRAAAKAFADRAAREGRKVVASAAKRGMGRMFA